MDPEGGPAGRADQRPAQLSAALGRLRPLRVERGHKRRYPVAVFRYNDTNYTIEDEERGLLVTQTGGPGHGVYAGLMTPNDGSWSFRFTVHYREVETANIDHPRFVHLGDGRGLVMRTSPPKGVWNRSETPAELARDAIYARAMYHRGLARSGPTG